MKLSFSKAKACVALAAVASVGLAGCLFDQNGTLDPTVSADIAVAYTNVCSALPALGPISASMNANAKNAYAQAQMICSVGAPTNAIIAGVDILALENALLPYFSKVSSTVPMQAKALKHLKAKYRS